MEQAKSLSPWVSLRATPAAGELPAVIAAMSGAILGVIETSASDDGSVAGLSDPATDAWPLGDYPRLMPNGVEMSPDRGFFRGLTRGRNLVAWIASRPCAASVVDLRGDVEAVGLTQRAEFEEEERQPRLPFQGAQRCAPFSCRLP
jgi:hypothetical protein